MASCIDWPVIWCRVFAVIFAIFTKVCRVFTILPWFSTVPNGCEQCRQTSVAAQLAADLPSLMANTDQLDQQSIETAEYQPTYFRFSESTYRKYLPDDRMSLIGRVEVGPAGISSCCIIVYNAWRYLMSLSVQVVEECRLNEDGSYSVKTISGYLQRLYLQPS